MGMLTRNRGTPKVTSYRPDDASVKLTAGWGRNGSYWQATNSSDQIVQFDFEGDRAGPTARSPRMLISIPGNGVLTYGMCTNTNEEFDTVLGDFIQGGYKSFLKPSQCLTFPLLTPVDGTNSVYGFLDSSTTPAYAVDDCLIQWELWLDSGKHNLTWNTESDPIMISRFDVVTFPPPPPPGSIVGTRTGTRTSSTRSGSSPTSSSSTSGSGSLSTGGIIGITLALVILLLAAVFGIVFWIQRNNRRNTPAMAVEDMYGKTDSPQTPGSQLSPAAAPTTTPAPALVPAPVMPNSPVMANAQASYNVTPLPLLQHNQPPLPAGNPTYYSSYNPYSSYPPVGGGSQVDVKRPLDFQEAGPVVAPAPPGGALGFRPLPSPGPPSPPGIYPSPASGQPQLPVGPSTTTGYSVYDSPQGPSASISDSASAGGRGGPAEGSGAGRTVLSADGYGMEAPGMHGGVQPRT